MDKAKQNGILLHTISCVKTNVVLMMDIIHVVILQTYKENVLL